MAYETRARNWLATILCAALALFVVSCDKPKSPDPQPQKPTAEKNEPGPTGRKVVKSEQKPPGDNKRPPVKRDQPFDKKVVTPKPDPQPAPTPKSIAKPRPVVKKPAKLRMNRRAQFKGRNKVSGMRTRGFGPGGGGLIRGVKEAEKKKDARKKQQPQVWKRSKTKTLLSKVSVGGKKYLQLKKMRVTVQVEGIRVRTIIDHIYYNPFDRTLQGKFKYTLPPDASISYYAMFVGQRQQRTPRFFRGKAPAPRQLIAMGPRGIVKQAPKKEWGKLREARLVSATKGRQVFENITRRRIDPALVEQDAPNTFAAKVFPVPAKGYNRVIIAYEQTLPAIGGEKVYRFRFPSDVAEWIDFSIDHNPSLATLSRHNLKKIRCNSKKEETLLKCYWEKNKPDRDAVFYFKPKREEVSWLAGTDPISNHKYLLTQVRVDLPKVSVGQGSERAILLLDTSLSENPDHFAANVMLLKKILEKNKQIKRFNVLFFDVGTSWADNGWIANTPEQRKKLFARLDEMLLEGATDFSRAMNSLAAPKWLVDKKASLDVFLLSDGQLNWGNRNVKTVLGAFEKRSNWGSVRFFAYRLGIGSENTVLYQQLSRMGGAVFTCLGKSELDRCATAHTKQSMYLEKVTIDGVDASEIMVAGRQTNLYPGALVTIAARIGSEGKATISLRGRFNGQKKTITVSMPVKARGDLAPRAWAELAVAQLLELGDPKLEKLVVAYSQHFRLANKYCSFLVLETDKEYKKYGLEKQLKDKRVADVSHFISEHLRKQRTPPTSKQLFIALMRKGAKKSGMFRTSTGRAVIGLLNRLPESAFDLTSELEGGTIAKSGVPKVYLQTRTKDANDFSPFVTEARRRLSKNLIGSAVRALSSIVEQHPSDPRALRLVGYYLMSWNRPAEASSVFLRVLERRPFEPHSYRDLARSLIKMKRYGLAAALYEVVLAGSWRRFRKIHVIAREEYALMMQSALANVDGLAKSLKISAREARQIQALLRQRKSLLGLSISPSKIRVTVTWNTDNTDIDLWVEEPSGDRVWYKKKRSRNGGVLLQDVTWGYGPERYQNVGGKSGSYKVRLQFYGHRSNVLGNETHATIMIVLHAGTKKQRVLEKNLVLKKRKQVVDVATLKL